MLSLFKDKTKEELIETGWWNYRFIVRHVYDRDKIKDSYYELIEVYYDGNGNIVAWTDESQSITVVSKKDLRVFMKQLKDASKRTVLEKVDGKLIDTRVLMPKLGSEIYARG